MLFRQRALRTDARATTSGRPSRGSRRTGFRPLLEALEDRNLPSTVDWINPAGGDWDTASNWLDTTTNTNHVPGPGDDAVIATGGITVTHTSATAESINSLFSQANIDWENGSLTLASGTLNGTTDIDAGAILNANVGNSGSVTLDQPLVNNGEINLIGTLTEGVGGAITNAAGATFVALNGGNSYGGSVHGGTFENAGAGAGRRHHQLDHGLHQRLHRHRPSGERRRV